MGKRRCQGDVYAMQRPGKVHQVTRVEALDVYRTDRSWRMFSQEREFSQAELPPVRGRERSFRDVTMGRAAATDGRRVRTGT